MLFSSYIFLLVFLPAVLAGFYALRANGARAASVSFLLVASFVFYGYWSLTHLVLLLASIGANFILGRLAATSANQNARKLFTTVGIIGNLSLIFWFKYLDFAGSNLAALAGQNYTLMNFLLPIGISFFTFQQVAYLVDCYKERTHEPSLHNYALFVSFFPQLIAGPIVHHGFTRPQFAALKTTPVNLDLLPYGLMIFAMGLAKKTLIADPIARAIDPLWASALTGDPMAAGAAWTAMVGYTLQIYFDFSGYCDMAIGLGLMIGIRLPINFNSPYKSKSIIEFWRRWHITLSAFLRDYVYIPFGGNRRGNIFRLRNIFITMLIGGIWHGAAWTFIIWGAIHATLITANHAMHMIAPGFTNWSGLSATIIKRTTTILFVMLAWVFFRAESLPTAINVISGLTAPINTGAVIDPAIFALMGLAGLVALFAPNSLEVAGYAENSAASPANAVRRIIQPTPLAATATAIMLAGGIVVAWQPAIFIYFNF